MSFGLPFYFFKNISDAVKLKNGSEQSASIVFTTMSGLSHLIQQNPIAFFDLVQKCNDSLYQMFANSQDEIVKLGLMDSAGKIPQITKDIILSAVKGDGLNMRLTDPRFISPIGQFLGEYSHELKQIALLIGTATTLCTAIYYETNHGTISNALQDVSKKLKDLWDKVPEFKLNEERDTSYGNYHRLM